MSAKRRPGTDLNHDNWDEEQEQEEVGEFRKAPEEVLKQRNFKVAKRRIRTGADGDAADGAPASVFSGFGGFGKGGIEDGSKSTSAAASPFSFLSTQSAGVSLGAFKSSSSGSSSNSSNGNNTNSASASSSDASSVYFAKLKGLNQSVSSWIAKHIAENPVCLLTPIFDDYAQHLKEIEETRKSAQQQQPPFKTPDFTFKSAATTSVMTTASTAATGAKSAFSFGTSSASKPTNDPFAAATSVAAATTSPKSTFSFGKSPPTSTADATASDKKTASSSSFGFVTSPTASTSTTASAITTPPKFSFGSAASTASTSSSGFSFGGAGAQPFSFANIKPPTAAESAASDVAAADDDNEEPPKNEFTRVVEEDSLHQQRCKVFVKSGADYTDRGVGQLYIKSAAGGSKTQLLVRADTNLGNILLNVLLTESVPASRMGKNNVMMICVPTPDAKPPPVTVLVRVKNQEEADELLEQINKHKK